jgi:hypothetical protein
MSTLGGEQLEVSCLVHVDQSALRAEQFSVAFSFFGFRGIKTPNNVETLRRRNELSPFLGYVSTFLKLRLPNDASHTDSHQTSI